MSRKPSAASGKKRHAVSVSSNTNTVRLAGGRIAQRPDASSPLRVVDSLSVMLKNGSIDTAQHDAGRAFAGDFITASFAGNTTVNLNPSGRGRTASGGTVTESVAFARKRVHAAIAAVGGMESLGGSALWDVCGLGLSVSQWALNRNIEKNAARGVLMLALEIAAKCYYFKR